MSIFPALISSGMVFLIWIVIVVFILSRFSRFQKETKARSVYQTVKQNPKLQPKKQPAKTETFAPKTEKQPVFSKPAASPFGQEQKKKRSFFGSREPDCDLDERVFGPRNQHKDLF